MTISAEKLLANSAKLLLTNYVCECVSLPEGLNLTVTCFKSVRWLENNQQCVRRLAGQKFGLPLATEQAITIAPARIKPQSAAKMGDGLGNLLHFCRKIHLTMVDGLQR